MRICWDFISIPLCRFRCMTELYPVDFLHGLVVLRSAFIHVSAARGWFLTQSRRGASDGKMLKLSRRISLATHALDGAESVTPGTLERFLARFRPYGLREDALTPAYGLAEAGLAVTCSSVRRSYSTRDFEGRMLVIAVRPLVDFRVSISRG